MAVLRSLIFYTLFYPASAVLVLGAALASPLGRSTMQHFPDAWSHLHRWLAHHVLGIRVRIEGTPSSEPVLYAIKHEAFFEAIDLPTLFHKPVPLAKTELYQIPGWGQAARAYGSVEIMRDGGAKMLRRMVSEAKQLLADGRPLIIFPEGTRVPHGTVAPLQSGFAGLYKLLGVPVIPVAVDSGPLYHRRWKRSGTVTIRFHDRIEPGLPRAEVEARVLAAINSLNPAGQSASA